ncbi:hypothetical protein SMICM304S_07543 [Streptomyces microflavus]
MTGERSNARTRAMGLRRDPQPPMPIVMPLCSRAATSSGVMVLLRAADTVLTIQASLPKVSRTRSAVPARLASKVKPCSKR